MRLKDASMCLRVLFKDLRFPVAILGTSHMFVHLISGVQNPLMASMGSCMYMVHAHPLRHTHINKHTNKHKDK